MSVEHACKVDEVIDRHGLETADPRFESLNEGLVRRWTGTDDVGPVGYRPLTEWFNKRLLKAVFDDHGRETLGDRVEHDYQALTSDDDLVREEIVESLDSDGIDGDGIRDEMVSWGTMRTHLQDCLGETKEREPARSDWERESIEMAQSFAVEKVESAISSLATKGQLDDGNVSVSVTINLDCDQCPTRVPFDVAMERGYVCEDHRPTGESSA